MRRIIEGKVYDTETATEVCDISGPNSCDRGNFSFNDTRLYRTPKGRFFIAGEGGAMSRWAQRVDGGGRCGGSGMCAVDESEARALVEEYGTADVYESTFGAAELA